MPVFGPDVTAAFCAANRISLVVRSHQFVREGVKFMHGGHLATLFSARNYFDQQENDSALLLVAADEQGKLRVRAKRLAHRVARTSRPPPNQQAGPRPVGLGLGAAAESAGAYGYAPPVAPLSPKKRKPGELRTDLEF